MSGIACKYCNGRGWTGPVHVNRGNGSGEWLDRMECTHCGGTGRWDSDHLARYEKGQAHRRERIERSETILEAAARLGVTPAQLSSFETGRHSLTPGSKDKEGRRE